VSVPAKKIPPKRPRIRANPKKTAHSRKKHKTRQAVHLCNVRQLQHPKKTAHSRKKNIKQGRQSISAISEAKSRSIYQQVMSLF